MVKFSVYLNRHVFVKKSQKQNALGARFLWSCASDDILTTDM